MLGIARVRYKIIKLRPSWQSTSARASRHRCGTGHPGPPNDCRARRGSRLQADHRATARRPTARTICTRRHFWRICATSGVVAWRSKLAIGSQQWIDPRQRFADGQRTKKRRTGSHPAHDLAPAIDLTRFRAFPHPTATLRLAEAALQSCLPRRGLHSGMVGVCVSRRVSPRLGDTDRRQPIAGDTGRVSYRPRETAFNQAKRRGIDPRGPERRTSCLV